MGEFLRAAFTYLLPVFVLMAVLVKATHAGIVRGRPADVRTVWIAVALPGAACTVAAVALGNWPVAVDSVLSALALALLGKRYSPPPRFEV